MNTSLTREYYKELYVEWAQTGQIKDHARLTCTLCNKDVCVATELSISQLKFGNRNCKTCLNTRARELYWNSRQARVWEKRKERVNTLYNASLTVADLMQVYHAFKGRCAFSGVSVEQKHVAFHVVCKDSPATNHNLMLVSKPAAGIVQNTQFVMSPEMRARIRRAQDRI